MTQPEAVVPQVPERWRDEYACILDGEIEDADVEKQLMEELGAAEAKVRELEAKLNSIHKCTECALCRWHKN